jgi:hypothetical protein
MQVLLKSGATLLTLTAAIGLAGGAAASLAGEARQMLEEQAAELDSLEARWAALGIPAEMTAPVAAIPAFARETLELPEELTEKATDMLTEANLEAASEITMTSTALTTTALTSTVATTSTRLISASSKVVALGSLEKRTGGPLYLVEKAGGWQPGQTGFYVHVRFIDIEGTETAFCTQYLGPGQRTSWTLDVSRVEALPPGWEGIGLVTVHDDVSHTRRELSEMNRIVIKRLAEAG